jgi:ABC-type antimicrobial peptide transport system permease subunit
LEPPGEWVEIPWDSILTVVGVLFWLICLILLLPGFIGIVGKVSKILISRLWRGIGRLVSDNLQRERSRVTQTALTLALALTMIISVTGFTRFQVDELLSPKLLSLSLRKRWVILPFDALGGMATFYNLETLELSPEILSEMAREFTQRLRVVETNIIIVPELSFIESTYFSFVYDPQELKSIGDFSFEFTQGDWESALPVMDSGCGVLISPLVAGKNNVSLGDVFDVTGVDGPVECVVAGIGSPFGGASILSIAAGDSFDIGKPMMAYLIPLPGVDIDDLETDLRAFVAQYENIYLMEAGEITEKQTEMVNQMPTVFNSLLLLAILAAALGVVNTTLMNVAERRREIGLLRAAGASHRQVRAVVVGEAALMGLIGGFVGLVAGSGITIIIATVYGGNAWGYPDLDLWAAAWRSVQPAMLTGLIGMIASSIVSAFAASFPIRPITRNAVIEIMQPEHRE